MPASAIIGMLARPRLSVPPVRQDDESIAAMLTRSQKQELIAARTDWFHSIDVGDGLVTPGTCSVDYQRFMWDTLKLPTDMRGLRVLDVGTYDGYFAFECE